MKAIQKTSKHNPTSQIAFEEWAGEGYSNFIHEYGVNLSSVQKIAQCAGSSVPVVMQLLHAHPSILLRARETRAQTLHDKSIDTVVRDPERMVYDPINNLTRIDPGSVQLMKLRADHYARLSGVLDRTYSDKQLTVEVTSSPLADAFAALLAKGSAILPQGATIDNDTQVAD